MMKKMIAVALALCFIGGALPVIGNYSPDTSILASAAYSGTCGENLTYTVDDEGTLTISGTGDMKNYGQAMTDVNIEGNCSPFKGNNYIKKVIIGDGVTSIGDDAFYTCKSLESITMGNSVTSIDYGAFAYCSGLKSVTIGNSVTSIGDNAFYCCASLASVTIPDSVTSIGQEAFAGCGLESITILNPDCKIPIPPQTICNGYDSEKGNFFFDGTIYGYENSTAQEYAANCEYNFVSLGVYYDVQDDVAVTSEDKNSQIQEDTFINDFSEKMN